jgi:hypothetical protein
MYTKMKTSLEFFRFSLAINRPIALHLQEIWIWHLFLWIAKVTEPLVLLHSLYDACFCFKFCLHILDFECRYYLFDLRNMYSLFMVTLHCSRLHMCKCVYWTLNLNLSQTDKKSSPITANSVGQGHEYKRCYLMNASISWTRVVHLLLLFSAFCKVLSIADKMHLYFWVTLSDLF